MLDQIKQGKSIIMISSEMPELMGMSDRIMVMCEGHVTGFVDKEHFDQVEIMRLASSFKKQRGLYGKFNFSKLLL